MRQEDSCHETVPDRRSDLRATDVDSADKWGAV